MQGELFEMHEQAGARMVEVDGWEAPDVFTTVEAEYAAAHTGAVIYDSSSRGRLRLTGSTRLDFLHRMSTNEMNALRPGQGAATILTTPIGRIIDRIMVYVRENDLLALTSRGAHAAVINWLKKYIFFNDDVQLHDVTGQLGMVSIYGPQASETVARLVDQNVSGLSWHAWQPTSEGAWVARADALAGAGFHIFTSTPAALAPLWGRAVESGVAPIGEQAFEALRIEAGLPRYGHELSETYIPLEVGLWRDVSFTKGCYIGQEIIARMESRQRLAKQLVGLRASERLESGTELSVDGTSIGKVSSAAHRAEHDWLALAFVKPPQAIPGTRVLLGTEPALEAEVTSFPIP
ncbi:MAG TPA: glycine cleavage system protein T [Anaerolineae bacterium]|nr:glycine cleavage system protein T [Anaerolineae bacterium]